MAWKQIAGALVIGFLLGAGFGAWQARQQLPHGMRHPQDQKKERMLQRFVSELKLTEPQKAKAENILGSAIDQMQALRAEMHPKFKAIRAEMNQEIRTVLTPDQLKRFEAMETQWEARMDRWHSK